MEIWWSSDKNKLGHFLAQPVYNFTGTVDGLLSNVEIVPRYKKRLKKTFFIRRELGKQNYVVVS